MNTIDLSNYSWGPTDEISKSVLTREFLEIKTYNTYYEVQENDIVLDVGASTGIWTYTILPNKPKLVICVNPSKKEFPHLVKNTLGHPVSHLNKAVALSDGLTDTKSVNAYYYDGVIETIRFKSLIELYGLERINFLKTDCEGGEYAIFIPENYDYLLNNVDIIVGEWHLEDPIQKLQFRKFRDTFLANHPNFHVHSVDGTNIKWDLWNEHFIEYYNQVIIHIDNRKHED